MAVNEDRNYAALAAEELEGVSGGGENKETQCDGTYTCYGCGYTYSVRNGKRFDEHGPMFLEGHHHEIVKIGN